MKRALRITTRIALAAAFSLAILGLLFRSLIWASWLPQGDDPYGASDVIELLIFYLVALFSFICVIAGVGLLFFKPRSWRMLAAGIAVPVAYVLLHPWVPTFQLW